MASQKDRDMADHAVKMENSRPASHVKGSFGIATNGTQRTTDGPFREGWPSGF